MYYTHLHIVINNLTPSLSLTLPPSSLPPSPLLLPPSFPSSLPPSPPLPPPPPSLLLSPSYSLNRLCELPRGFGSFPALEILDLTYNNLTNSSFSANFSYLGECLRCLYMGDNDLTEFPPQIEKFVHLEIVS